MRDSIVYLDRLHRQRTRFGFEVKAVGLDARYATYAIVNGLENSDILDITGYRNPTPPGAGTMPKSKFGNETGADRYHCPEGQLLTYATTTATTISTTCLILPSAAVARFGVVHIERKPHPHHRLPCLRRCPRAHPVAVV